jgi:hypothetical protein
MLARNPIPARYVDVQFALYFDVSPIGAVRYAEVVYSSRPVNSKEILNGFVGTHFPIKSCEGRAVGYETVITFERFR